LNPKPFNWQSSTLTT